MATVNIVLKNVRQVSSYTLVFTLELYPGSRCICNCPPEKKCISARREMCEVVSSALLGKASRSGGKLSIQQLASG